MVSRIAFSQTAKYRSASVVQKPERSGAAFSCCSFVSFGASEMVSQEA